MNGRVIPATGMMPIVMPTFSKTWNVSMLSTPAQIRVPARSRESTAARQLRQIMSTNRASRSADPGEAELLCHGGEYEIG